MFERLIALLVVAALLAGLGLLLGPEASPTEAEAQPPVVEAPPAPPPREAPDKDDEGDDEPRESEKRGKRRDRD